jgi:dUTP pyrophosphatase
MSVAKEMRITRLPHAEGLPVPTRKTEQAAGFDLAAAVPGDRPVSIGPGQRALIDTGFVVAIPDGHEGQVRPRSGLALELGLTVLNAPGTIDADYRGELKVLLVNHGDEQVTVNRGMRIAQLIVAPLSHVTEIEVSESADIGDTVRGAGGFGSTGVG